jgi:hypothetical protein
MTSMIDSLERVEATVRQCSTRAQACRRELDDVAMSTLIAPSVQGEAPEGMATGDPLFQRI